MRFKAFVLITLACAALVSSPSAWAQSNPSSDEIIGALKPAMSPMGLTRGLRPSGTAPASPSPGQHATGSAAPHVNLQVEFRTGSADLTAQAVQTLNELGRALASEQLATYRFRIEGHTDTVGSPEMNRALSDRRARAVVDYLATKFGVARTRLEPVGMGQDGLLVPTPPQTPEARNRRVEVINISA